ncbi:hypothetical protein [Streptomyces sp. PA5.6]|uniref:hypothetical protein n=1 Tax=Streptomyces sp. PA5.6 TaxID=3035651 RepID=UPI003904AF58
MTPFQLCGTLGWDTDDYCFRCEEYGPVTPVGEMAFGGTQSVLSACPYCYVRLWQSHWAKVLEKSRKTRAARAPGLSVLPGAIPDHEHVV